MAPEPDPTEAEIAAACERIRDGWSEAEMRKRSAWATSPRWVAPTAEFDDEVIGTE
jgi:hypothetical protein